MALWAGASVAAPQSRDREPVWLGEELPLPLSVQTPDDLAFKAEAERQFLLFNLLVGGKQAWDKGDMATAANKWELLLATPGLPRHIDDVVRPLAQAARARAGNASTPLVVGSSVGSAPSATSLTLAPKRPLLTIIQGRVSGLSGSPGAVVWLKRADGSTPKPKPVAGRVIYQREKKFSPRLMAVPVGTEVRFLNQDAIFHNVFSLSKPNDFDLGLYKTGTDRAQRFSQAGPVSLLCNIHAAMSAFIYVVDTPYYAQTDRRGTFTIRNVPPGDYIAYSWQETSAEPTQKPVTVSGQLSALTLSVTNDKPLSQFPPDKSGKPRQPHLGY
ncbi:MAG: hypothetical protein ACKVPX_06270 [Myxococcaceae bacterium]